MNYENYENLFTKINFNIIEYICCLLHNKIRNKKKFYI